MADSNTANGNNQLTTATQNGNLSVGRIYIDQYNDRNNPLNGFQKSGSDSPATVKDIEKIVDAIRDSFSDYIDIQRSYIDSDRAEQNTQSDSSNSTEEKKISEDDIDNNDNSIENEENSKNVELQKTEGKQKNAENGKNELTLQAKSDIISFDENNLNDGINENRVNIQSGIVQETVSPSFESVNVISEKINEENSVEDDKSDVDKVISNNYDSIFDFNKITKKETDKVKNTVDNKKGSSNTVDENQSVTIIKELKETTIKEPQINDSAISNYDISEIEEFKANKADIFSLQEQSDDTSSKQHETNNDQISYSEEGISSIIGSIESLKNGTDDENNSSQPSIAESSDFIESETSKTLISVDVGDEPTISVSEQSSSAQDGYEKFSNNVKNDIASSESEIENSASQISDTPSSVETLIQNFFKDTVDESGDTPETDKGKTLENVDSDDSHVELISKFDNAENDDGEIGEYDGSYGSVVEPLSNPVSNINDGLSYEAQSEEQNVSKSEISESTDTNGIMDMLGTIAESIKDNSESMSSGFSELKSMLSSAKTNDTSESSDNMEIPNVGNAIDFNIERI